MTLGIAGRRLGWMGVVPRVKNGHRSRLCMQELNCLAHATNGIFSGGGGVLWGGGSTSGMVVWLL